VQVQYAKANLYSIRVKNQTKKPQNQTDVSPNRLMSVLFIFDPIDINFE